MSKPISYSSGNTFDLFERVLYPHPANLGAKLADARSQLPGKAW